MGAELAAHRGGAQPQRERLGPRPLARGRPGRRAGPRLRAAHLLLRARGEPGLFQGRSDTRAARRLVVRPRRRDPDPNLNVGLGVATALSRDLTMMVPEPRVSAPELLSPRSVPQQMPRLRWRGWPPALPRGRRSRRPPPARYLRALSASPRSASGYTRSRAPGPARAGGSPRTAREHRRRLRPARARRGGTGSGEAGRSRRHGPRLERQPRRPAGADRHGLGPLPGCLRAGGAQPGGEGHSPPGLRPGLALAMLALAALGALLLRAPAGAGD